MGRLNRTGRRLPAFMRYRMNPCAFALRRCLPTPPRPPCAHAPIDPFPPLFDQLGRGILKFLTLLIHLDPDHLRHRRIGVEAPADFVETPLGLLPIDTVRSKIGLDLCGRGKPALLQIGEWTGARWTSVFSAWISEWTEAVRAWVLPPNFATLARK